VINLDVVFKAQKSLPLLNSPIKLATISLSVPAGLAWLCCRGADGSGQCACATHVSCLI